jgi:signal transduction histidine kinase
MKFNDQAILIVSADASVTRECVDELTAFGFQGLSVASSIEEARVEIRKSSPSVVFLDESAVQGASYRDSLESMVGQFTETAPVVVAAAPERLAEMAFLITSGAVDFVARTRDFPRAAAGLLGRRLRLGDHIAKASSQNHINEVDDFGELLRHEVNNPLTGILGNTELLLARPEQLPSGAIERLQTIADLAVRLREIVRNLSNTWEANHQPVRPA